MVNEKIEDEQSILDDIDAVLGITDLSKVTAESTGFEDLPDGYFLTEVVESKLERVKSGKNQGKPKATIKFKIIEDGYKLTGDPNSDEEETTFDTLAGTKNRTLYKHYPLGDPEGIKKLVSDMKKFEDPETPGKQLLPDEAWTTASTLKGSIEVLSQLNIRIWVHNKVTVKDDGTSSNWVDLESFSRAAQLGLPVD